MSKSSISSGCSRCDLTTAQTIGLCLLQLSSSVKGTVGKCCYRDIRIYIVSFIGVVSVV